MTPKTWREVELWQEYLRGFVAGLRVQWAKVEEDTSEALDELASLEALKPCSVYGGAGKHHGTNCPYCVDGSGIEGCAR